MNRLWIAIALGCMAAPAFAQSIDLPRLTWPTETTVPATQAGNDPATLATTAKGNGK